MVALRLGIRLEVDYFFIGSRDCVHTNEESNESDNKVKGDTFHARNYTTDLFVQPQYFLCKSAFLCKARA